MKEKRINLFQVSEDRNYITGRTLNGEAFLFDFSDYQIVKKYYWSVSKRGYAVTKIKRRDVPMHKILLQNIIGYDIDHISGDKLDNRRSNLRVCTHQQNMFNQNIRSNNTSGYIGVSFMKKIGKYEAYVHYSGKKYHMGLYNDIIDAAVARDKGAIKLFGEYVRLNFKRSQR